MDTNIKQGDIFKLGNHVLICGDASNEEDLKKLLTRKNGGLIKTDQLLTDPHYCQVIINRREEYTGEKAEKLT